MSGPKRDLAIGPDPRVWDLLRAAGVTADGDRVRRVIIDIPFDDAVRVWVEKFVDDRILELDWSALKGAEIRFSDSETKAGAAQEDGS